MTAYLNQKSIKYKMKLILKERSNQLFKSNSSKYVSLMRKHNFGDKDSQSINLFSKFFFQQFKSLRNPIIKIKTNQQINQNKQINKQKRQIQNNLLRQNFKFCDNF
ncbi:hypothetical protein ABPG74_002906 [Tetrahymena malaccensis]